MPVVRWWMTSPTTGALAGGPPSRAPGAGISEAGAPGKRKKEPRDMEFSPPGENGMDEASSDAGEGKGGRNWYGAAGHGIGYFYKGILRIL